jgi:hypothetical protein
VNKNCLFAYSSSVAITFPNRQTSKNTLPLVRLRGPGTLFLIFIQQLGIIYIENAQEQIPSPTSALNQRRNIFPFLAFWVYIILSVVVWMIGIM